MNLIETRPAPLTPYERLRWQQENCKENVIGYAVALVAESTTRAAYLTTTGKFTNREAEAAVLTRESATSLMTGILTDENLVEWTRKGFWEIAFLVPVSPDLPLTFCTFGGY